jgi:hypothetical protein
MLGAFAKVVQFDYTRQGKQPEGKHLEKAGTRLSRWHPTRRMDGRVSSTCDKMIGTLYLACTASQGARIEGQPATEKSHKRRYNAHRPENAWSLVTRRKLRGDYPRRQLALS